MQALLSPPQIAARCGMTRQHLHLLFKQHGKPEAMATGGRLTVYGEDAVARWLDGVSEKYAVRFHRSAARTSGSNQSAS